MYTICNYHMVHDTSSKTLGKFKERIHSTLHEKQKTRFIQMTWDCPLCMEHIDASDSSFTPCECGYQICRFCWHHIKTTLNDKCPACRRSYSQQEKEGILDREILPISKSESIKDSFNSQPNRISQTPILQKYQHLADTRIIQRNLVYVIGIPYDTKPQSISLEEKLSSSECFGKYGNVIRIVLNTKRKYRPFGAFDSQIKTISAFVTFSTAQEASMAIQNIDNSIFDGVTLHATYGTTKYCAFFLRGQSCPNVCQCLFLHSIDDHKVSDTDPCNIEPSTNSTTSSNQDNSEMNDIVAFLKSALPNASIHT